MADKKNEIVLSAADLFASKQGEITKVDGNNIIIPLEVKDKSHEHSAPEVEQEVAAATKEPLSKNTIIGPTRNSVHELNTSKDDKDEQVR